MRIIEDIIIPAMQDKNNVFVFPSEVAARQIQKKALSLSGGRISRNRQFISWDQFKEQTLVYAIGKKPSNRHLRTLFTERLLALNKKKRLFKTLIHPEYAENSGAYLHILSGFLPVLYRIRDMDAVSAAAMDPGRFHDLKLLLARYLDFLDRNGLYEPAYEKPGFAARDDRYTVFFPEAIKDFAGIKPVLPAGPQITFVALSALAGDKPPEIAVLSNTIAEVKRTLLEIAGLCDRGVDPAEIVLTVAEPERIASFLSEQAELLGLNLSFHYGKPLIGYPGVNFLNQIRNVYASGFALAEMKDLIHNLSLPWKQEDTAQELIRFGTVYNCFKNYFDGKKAIDVWQSNLQRLSRSKEYSAPALESLASFYSRLKTHITAIGEAGNFKELKLAVDDFYGDFFLPHALSEDLVFYYEYAQRILTELEENQAQTDLPAAEAVFDLWLVTLKDTRYVKPEAKGGIAVYPYRVAAGIQPQYHFVINASQQNTQYIIKNHPFLHPDEETDSGGDLDLSDPYMELYCYSGREVTVSYARRDFSDSHLAPAFFIARGEIRELAADEYIKSSHALWQEFVFWTARKVHKSMALSAPQKQGFFHAATTVLADKANDFTRAPMSNAEQIRTIIPKLPHEQGRLRVSPTGLENFSNCPFSFLLAQALQLAPLAYEPEILNPMWVGDIIHRVFQLFFEKLRDGDGKFLPENISAYQGEMAGVLEVLSQYFHVAEPLPLGPVWEYLLQGLMDNCLRFLEVEARTFPGREVLWVEHTAALDWEEPAAALRGKIDRVSAKDDKLTIVDYKKRGTPSRKDIFSKYGSPCSFQMPFYYYLLAEQGWQVAGASYYSFEKASYIHVLNGDDPHAYATSGDFIPAVALLKEKISGMIESVHRGDFSIPSGEPPLCGNCDFRGVCRDKFVLG